MLHARTLSRLRPFLLCAALAAAPASAQSRVLWKVPGPVVTFANDLPRTTFPDGRGGSLFFEFGNSAADETRLRAVDANGNERWLRTTPIVSTGARETVTSDGAGRLVSVVGDPANLRLDVEGLDVDGGVRWTRSVTAPPPTPSYWPGAGLAVEHPSGEVTLAATFAELDTTHFLTRGSTTVVRLDAAGVERWRTTIPEHRIQRLDVDGDEVVLCLGQQNGILDQYPLRVTRLDADGATLWSELLASGAIQASFTVSEVLFEPTSGDVLVQWAVESGGFSASSVGITSIDASGDVAWTWSPSGLSGLEQTAGGMVFGASGGLLVGAVGRVSFDDRTRIYDLDPLTGAERHSIEFLERSIGAEKGLQPLPGGGAMVVLYDWPAGPFLVTLDADLDVTSTLALQPPPVSAIDPRTRLQTATPDGRGGLVLTGYDSYSGAPQPGVYLFRMKVAAGVDLGAAYCAQTSPNSTGATTALEAFGSAAAADDDVTLIGSALPPFAASLFLVADQAGFAPNAGGSQGTLCLGGAIGRYNRPGEVQFASAEGGVTLRLDLANTPGPSAVFAVLPGTTWRFQLWHRDMNPGQTSNLSNALEVTFL